MFDIGVPVVNFVKEECSKSTKKGLLVSSSLYKTKKNVIPKCRRI